MSAAEERIEIGTLMAPDIVDLLVTKRLGDARAAMAELHDAELADMLVAMEPDKRVMAMRLLPRATAADVFAHLDYDDQEDLVELMSNEAIAAIFDEMDPDDRVDFFEDADEELTDQLLALMKPEERAETEAILEYPDESVGREITPDYLTVEPQWTVAEALDHIRREGQEAESLDTLYVVDVHGKLLNQIRLRRLILSDPGAKIDDLLRPDSQLVSLKTTDDREELVHAFEKYDVPVVPVVDDAEKLVGIVTFDDVADVAEEEMTEDMQKMGGMEALDEPYRSATILELVRKRVIWLMILFGGGLLTVWAMGGFKDSIEKTVVLALFVPLIIASGGNSGSQAASLMIRSLAIGELAPRDWLMVLRRELASGVLLGIIVGLCGAVAGALAAIMVGVTDATPMRYALAIGVSVLCVILIGTVTGSMLPFLLKHIGLDEATSSTPFVATVVDVAGLILYFVVANLILFGSVT